MAALTCNFSPRTDLGVKWSQVQILSARQRKPLPTSVGRGFLVRWRGAGFDPSQSKSHTFALVAPSPAFQDVPIVRNGLRYIDVVRLGHRAGESDASRLGAYLQSHPVGYRPSGSAPAHRVRFQLTLKPRVRCGPLHQSLGRSARRAHPAGAGSALSGVRRTMPHRAHPCGRGNASCG